MDDEKNKKNEIEIISGDGSNLDISPVYEYINVAKPKNKEKKQKEIIVPKNKKIQKN